MNLYRPQQPYVFFPPLHAPWFRPVLHVLSGVYRRFKFNIREVTITGGDQLAALAAGGHAILVAPNHADHADPSLMIHVGRRHGIAFHFMAAREGFERSRVERFVLQRSGCFSVDREGADLASIKMAMNILRDGKHPLIVFPEGEIYHHHEELDFLNEGVATILLRSSEKLPAGRRGYAVPAAIQVRHVPEVAETFGARIGALERGIGLTSTNGGIVERIYRYGGALLASKEREFTGSEGSGTLVERIRALQSRLIEEAEGKHGVTPRDPVFPARIKALRHIIRQKLNTPSSAVDRPPTAVDPSALYADLDRIFAAQQLYSYPGQYLSSAPTVDRIAETLFKLEEDVHGIQNYPSRRRAEIAFGTPIEVGQFLRETGCDAKSAARPLTERLRVEITGLIKTAKLPAADL